MSQNVHAPRTGVTAEASARAPESQPSTVDIPGWPRLPTSRPRGGGLTCSSPVGFLFLVALFFFLVGSTCRIVHAQQTVSLDDQLTALESGSLASLKAFLGSHPAAVADARGRTPLAIVVQWDRDRLAGARLLVAAGAPINARDEYGETALGLAAYRGDAELVRFLLASGADPALGTPLHQALFTWSRPEPGDALETVHALLAAGAPVHACDRDGRRAVQLAAMRPQAVEVVDLLLRNGADPDEPDPVTGNTPLQWAAAAASTRGVQRLLAAGVAVNARNRFDCTTALHRAASAGDVEALRALLAAGAEVNPTDRTAATPLALAESRGHAQAAALLRQSGGRLATLATASCEDAAVRQRRPCSKAATDQAVQIWTDGDFPGAIAFVETAVREWEAEHGVLVSPEIALEISSNLSFAAGMLCTGSGSRPPDSPGGCRPLLAPGEPLRRLIHGFLAETLLERRGEVRSPFARFGDALGVDAEAQMGYPALQPNRYACVDLPQPGRARLPVLGGSRESAGVVSRICLPPGDYELEVSSPTGPSTHRLSVGLRQAAIEGSHREPALPALVLPALSAYCGEAPDAPTHPMARWGGRDAPAGRPAAAGAFATSIAGDLATADPAGWCGPACRSAIGLTTVAAIQVWKGACDDCLPMSLAAVRVDGQVFLDRVLLDRLLLAADLDGALASPLPVAEEGSLSMNRFSVAGPRPRKPFAPFVRVAPGSQLAQSLCRRLAAAKSAAAGVLRSLLCGAGSGPGDAVPAAPLRIETLDRAACLPGAIACATVQQGLTLNGGDFRFRAPEGVPAATPMGRGAETVDLLPVLIHEVGHWFGLPHLDDSTLTPDGRLNAMYPSLSEKGLCVTPSNLQMLANAGRGDWYYRQTDCAGLRATPEAR
jgi:ankyrin repeat protein